GTTPRRQCGHFPRGPARRRRRCRAGNWRSRNQSQENYSYIPHTPPRRGEAGDNRPSGAGFGFLSRFIFLFFLLDQFLLRELADKGFRQFRPELHGGRQFVLAELVFEEGAELLDGELLRPRRELDKGFRSEEHTS